ncbi:MAG TPA: PxKF domain-containing protein [Blastocatellia bacterium]|nr:PxKF domain-containing protein [Blastocatellia bacterium]
MEKLKAHRRVKRRNLVVSLSILALVVVGSVGRLASAHSIDYLAMNISPASMFNGQSGNFTVNAPVAGGSSITFELKYQINTQGSTTTYPRTIGFGSQTQTKPAGAADATVSGVNTHMFTSSSSAFTDNITIVAPNTPGPYTVKIEATSGTGGQNGLSGGGGIAISFTVAAPDSPGCNHADTELAMSDSCIVLRQATTTLSATLTSGGSPLANKLVDFTVDGNPAGSATTDNSGVASVSYDTSSLSAGDHTVVATFAGDSCDYNGSAKSATLGVTYTFIGFQQPINADGSSQFGGRVIPVKIKIADAYGAPVPDADAHVFFQFGTPAVVGTDAEPVGNTSPDGGNTMRYDPAANQYIFNWDVGSLANGTYTIRVDLGEGSCGDPHLVTISLKKKGK